MHTTPKNKSKLKTPLRDNKLSLNINKPNDSNKTKLKIKKNKTNIPNALLTKSSINLLTSSSYISPRDDTLTKSTSTHSNIDHTSLAMNKNDAQFPKSIFSFTLSTFSNLAPKKATNDNLKPPSNNLLINDISSHIPYSPKHTHSLISIPRRLIHTRKSNPKNEDNYDTFESDFDQNLVNLNSKNDIIHNLPQFHSFQGCTPLETIQYIRQYITTIQSTIHNLRLKQTHDNDEVQNVLKNNKKKLATVSVLHDPTVQELFNNLNTALTSITFDPTMECYEEAEFLCDEFGFNLAETHTHLFTNNSKFDHQDKLKLNTNHDDDFETSVPNSESSKKSAKKLSNAITTHENLSSDESFYLNLTILRAYTLFNDLNRSTLLAMKLIKGKNLSHLLSLTPVLCDLSSALCRDGNYKLALYLLHILFQNKIPHSRGTPFVLIAKEAAKHHDIATIDVVMDIILTPYDYFHQFPSEPPLDEMNGVGKLSTNDQSDEPVAPIKPKRGRPPKKRDEETVDGKKTPKTPKTAKNEQINDVNSLQNEYNQFQNDFDRGYNPYDDEYDHQQYEFESENDKNKNDDENNAGANLTKSLPQYFESFLDREENKLSRIRHRQRTTGVGISTDEEVLILRSHNVQNPTDLTLHSAHSTHSTHSPSLTHTIPGPNTYKPVLLPWKIKHLQSILASSLSTYANCGLKHYTLQVLLNSTPLLNGRSPISLLSHHNFVHDTNSEAISDLLEMLIPIVPAHLHSFEILQLKNTIEKGNNALFASKLYNSRMTITESNFLQSIEEGNIDGIGRNEHFKQNLQKNDNAGIGFDIMDKDQYLSTYTNSGGVMINNGIHGNMVSIDSLDYHFERANLVTNLPRLINNLIAENGNEDGNQNADGQKMNHSIITPDIVLSYITQKYHLNSLQPQCDFNTDSYLFTNHSEVEKSLKGDQNEQNRDQNNTFKHYSKLLKSAPMISHKRLFPTAKQSLITNGNYNDLGAYSMFPNMSHQELFSKKKSTLDNLGRNVENNELTKQQFYLSQRLFYTNPRHFPVHYSKQHDISLFPDYLPTQFALIQQEKDLNAKKYGFGVKNSVNFEHLSSIHHKFKMVDNLNVSFGKVDDDDDFDNNFLKNSEQNPLDNILQDINPVDLDSPESALAQLFYPSYNLYSTNTNPNTNHIPQFISPFLKTPLKNPTFLKNLFNTLTKYPSFSYHIKCILFPHHIHQTHSYDYHPLALQDNIDIHKMMIKSLFDSGEVEEGLKLFSTQLTSLTSNANIQPVVDIDRLRVDDKKVTKFQQFSPENSFDKLSEIFKTFQYHLYTEQPANWNLLSSLDELPNDPSSDQNDVKKQIFQLEFSNFLHKNENLEIETLFSALFPSIYSPTRTNPDQTGASRDKNLPQGKYLKGGRLNPHYMGFSRNNNGQNSQDNLAGDTELVPFHQFNAPLSTFNPIPYKPTHKLYSQNDISSFYFQMLPYLISTKPKMIGKSTARPPPDPTIALAIWNVFGKGPNAGLMMNMQLPLINSDDLKDINSFQDKIENIEHINNPQHSSPFSTAKFILSQLSSPQKPHTMLKRIYSLAHTLPYDQLCFFQRTISDAILNLPFPITQIQSRTKSSIIPHEEIPQNQIQKQLQNPMSLILSTIIESAKNHGQNERDAIVIFITGLQPQQNLYSLVFSNFYKLFQRNSFFKHSIHFHHLLNPTQPSNPSPSSQSLIGDAINKVKFGFFNSNVQNGNEGNHKNARKIDQIQSTYFLLQKQIGSLTPFEHELTTSLITTNPQAFPTPSDENTPIIKGYRGLNNVIDSPEALIVANDEMFNETNPKSAKNAKNNNFDGLSFSNSFFKTRITMPIPVVLPFTPKSLVHYNIGHFDVFGSSIERSEIVDVNIFSNPDIPKTDNNLSENNDENNTDKLLSVDEGYDSELDDMIPTALFNKIISKQNAKTDANGSEEIKNNPNDPNNTKHQKYQANKASLRYKQHQLRQLHTDLSTRDDVISTEQLGIALCDMFINVFTLQDNFQINQNGNNINPTSSSSSSSSSTHKNDNLITPQTHKNLKYLLNTFSPLLTSDPFQYPSSYHYTTSFQNDIDGITSSLNHFSKFQKNIQKYSNPTLSLHISLSHRLLSQPLLARLLSHASLITGQYSIYSQVWDRFYFLSLDSRMENSSPKNPPTTISSSIHSTKFESQNPPQPNFTPGFSPQNPPRRIKYAGEDDNDIIPDSLESPQSPFRKTMTSSEWANVTTPSYTMRIGVSPNSIFPYEHGNNYPVYPALAHWNQPATLKLLLSDSTKQILPFSRLSTPVTTPDQLEYRILNFLRAKLTEYSNEHEHFMNNRNDPNISKNAPTPALFPLVNGHVLEHTRFVGNRIPRWSGGRYDDELLTQFINSELVEKIVLDSFDVLGMIHPHQNRFKRRNGIDGVEHGEDTNHQDGKNKTSLSTHVDGNSLAQSFINSDKNVLQLLTQQVQAVQGIDSEITKNNFFVKLYKKQLEEMIKNNQNFNPNNLTASQSQPRPQNSSKSIKSSIQYPLPDPSLEFDYHRHLTQEQKLFLVSEALKLDSTFDLRYFFTNFLNTISFRSLLYTQTTSLMQLSPYQRTTARTLNYLTTAVQSGFPQIASIFLLKSLSHPQMRQFIGFQLLSHGHVKTYRNSIQKHPLFFLSQHVITQMLINYPTLAYQTYLMCENAGLFQPFTDTTTLELPGVFKRDGDLVQEQQNEQNGEISAQARFNIPITRSKISSAVAAPLPSQASLLFDPKLNLKKIFFNSDDQNDIFPGPNNINLNNNTNSNSEKQPTPTTPENLYNTIYIRLLLQAMTGIPLFIDVNSIYPKEHTLSLQSGRKHIKHSHSQQSTPKSSPATSIYTPPPQDIIQHDKNLLMGLISSGYPLLTSFDSPFLGKNIHNHPIFSDNISHKERNSTHNDPKNTPPSHSIYHPVNRSYVVAPPSIFAKYQHELDLSNILIDNTILPHDSQNVSKLGKQYAGIRLSDFSPNTKKRLGYFYLSLISSNPSTQTLFSYMQPTRWTDTISSVSLGDAASKSSNNSAFSNFLVESDPDKLHIVPMDNSENVGLHGIDYTPAYIYNNQKEKNQKHHLENTHNSHFSDQQINRIINDSHYGLVRKLSTASGMSFSQMYFPPMVNQGENNNNNNNNMQTIEHNVDSHSHKQPLPTLLCPRVTLDTSGMFHGVKMMAIKSLYDRNLHNFVKIPTATSSTSSNSQNQPSQPNQPNQPNQQNDEHLLADFMSFQAKNIISTSFSTLLEENENAVSKNNEFMLVGGNGDQFEAKQDSVDPFLNYFGSNFVPNSQNQHHTIDISQLQDIDRLVQLIADLPNHGSSIRPD